MTAAIPSSVPDELIAGDTWSFALDFGDYPAGTWTATIYFEFSGSQFSSAAIASGTTHSFTIAAVTTATKKAGRYKWWIRATDGSTTTTIDDGWTDVKPDPAAAGTRDHRSWARRTLDAVEATLEGRATTDQLAVAINGRSISRIPLPELTQWQTQLEQRVRTEEGGTTAAAGRSMKVRLLRA